MIENSESKQSALLQQLSAAFIAIPFNKLLGLQLDHLTADEVLMSFSMKDELVGNYMHGILHGGVISSVLDMAGGMVVMASGIEKSASLSAEAIVSRISNCSTIDLHINYLRQGKGERFLVKANIEKSGRQISFARMELVTENNTLIATASGTYLLAT